MSGKWFRTWWPVFTALFAAIAITATGYANITGRIAVVEEKAERLDAVPETVSALSAKMDLVLESQRELRDIMLQERK